MCFGHRDKTKAEKVYLQHVVRHHPKSIEKQIIPHCRKSSNKCQLIVDQDESSPLLLELGLGYHIIWDYSNPYQKQKRCCTEKSHCPEIKLIMSTINRNIS